MSSIQKSIKVIKREQRELIAAQTEEVSEPQVKTEIETRREIFRTITLWVEEQKRRKR